MTGNHQSVKSQYLSRIRTDHYAISRKNLAHQGERRERSKIGVKQIQDGAGRHLEFSIFGHISVGNEDIFVKFGTLLDIGHTKVNSPIYPTFDKI